MKKFVLVTCVLALVIPVAALAQKAFAPSVRVHDKSVDVSKFKTYEWTPGHKALDPAMDQAIVAAIDKEMAAKGLKKASPADVAVTYHAVQRTDVDLSTADNKQPSQLLKVGTLAIDLLNPTTRAVIWRVAGEGVMKDMPAAERQAFAAKAVSELFTAYPTAPVKK